MGIFVSRCFEASIPHDYGDGNDRVLRIEILEQESILSDSNVVLRVMTKNINSTLLASKSPFFQKMFSNGMRESKEKQVTLKIAAYEEVAFMELLDYIKFNTLPKRDELWLLELLMIADKFEVPSCVRSCIDSLLSLPRTCELALLFSSLPSSIYRSGLMDAIQEFFGKVVTTLDVFPEDIGGVDQAVIEMVLCRDDLCVVSEDVTYDFLMKWVTSHFSDLEERREFLHSHVRKLIRFPHLSESKLSEFEQCPHVDREFAMKIKSECLYHKQRKQWLQRTGRKLGSRDKNNLLYAKRLYALQSVEIKRPDPDDDQMCEVLFELEKEELQDLERVAVKNSDTIRVGSHEFYLSFECKSKKGNDTLRSLGLCLHMRQVPWLTLVDFDVAYAVKRRPDEFERKVHLEKKVFNRRRNSIVVDYFLDTKLDVLLAEDSKFFIDGTLLLKVTIHVT